MPQGFSSAARNLFLLGATGQSLVSNFFRSLDQSSVSDTSSWKPRDIIHSDSNEKYYIGGGARNTFTNKDIGFIESRDWDDETDPENPTTTQEWFETRHTVENTTINCMDQDAAGNLIVGGYFQVSGDEVPFFAKYSTAGVLNWQSSTYSGRVSYNSVCSDSNNTYYACGEKTPDANGQAEAFVEKFDANGNPSWGKSCILVGRQIKLLGIAANDRGEVVAVGSIEDDSVTKGFIIKIDTSTGEVLWDKTIRSHERLPYSTTFKIVTCEDIYIDDNDQIYVVGGAGSGINGVRGFIIKYTAEGNVIWQKETATTNQTAARYYKVKADTETEQVVVYGQYVEFGGGPLVGLLTKYNKAGNIVWRRTINPDTSNAFGGGFISGNTLGMDADPSNIYLTYTDGTVPNNFYSFGRVSSAGNGLGNFQYEDGQSNTIDYNTLSMEDQIGRLYDGSVSQNSSDLITYPFSANKIVFDDLATHVSNKKRQMDSAEGFDYSGSPAIRPTDFQELNLLGDAYSGSGDWLDQSGKGNDATVSFGGGGSSSISQIVVPGNHPGSYNYGTGGAVTYDTYGTVNEDTTTTLPYSNSDWTHYGGKARDLGTGGFKVTLTNSATSNFFMACWVKFDTYATSRQMGVDLFGNYVYWETLANGNVAVRHNGGSRADSTGGTNLNDGNWHHIALSRDGSTLSGYVDGNIVVSTNNGVSGNSVPANAEFWFFGGSGTAYNFDGQILDPIINIGTGTSGGILVPTKPAIDSNGVFGEGGSGTGPFYSNSWEYASPAITLGGGTFDAEPFTGAGSVKFDGDDDYLNISNASTLSGFSGDFTIEFWFKGPDQTAFAVFLETYNSSPSSGQKWAIQAESSGSANMIWVRDGGIKFTTSGIDALDDAWHHHAVVRDGSTITYYIDGVSRGSETFAGALTSCTDLIIGDWSQGIGSWGIEGYLSNVRIVDGTAVYTSNFTPPTSPLTNITNTKLLCCQFDDIQTINTGKMYKSDTLYTTKAEVVLNGTLVDNGEQFDTDSSTSATADDVYFYYVPSGNETNGNQIFSTDPGFVNDGGTSFTTWWSYNGSNWVWGSGTGTYNNADYASVSQFLFGTDGDTYRLDQNIDFYGVGENAASSPTKMGGTAPTLNQYGTDTLTSAVSPGTIEMNGGARTMVTTTGTPISGPTHNAAGYWEFNGTNDYIQLPTNSDLTFAFDFSYETWLWTDVQPASNHVWSLPDGQTFQFTTLNSQQELIYYSVPTGNQSFGPLANNTWAHYVITKSGNTITGYLNGVQAWTSTPGSSATHNFSGASIGYRTISPAYQFHWDGRMGEIRIYPKTLSAAEVFQNYNATQYKYTGIRPNTSPKIGPGVVYGSNLLLNYDFGNGYCIEKSSLVSQPTYETIIDDATTNGAAFGDGQCVATGYGKVVVGARGETNGVYTAGGKAYIYNASTGALEVTLSPSDISGNDWNFGNAVAICNCSGKIAVTSSSALYLYDADGTNEIIIDSNSTLPISPPGGNTFGNGLAISGNRVWVSDDNVPTGPNYNGTVYCFNAETGAFLYELRPKNEFDNFIRYGVRITAGDGVLAIGAESIAHPVTGRSNTGRVYLYTLDGKNEKILEPDDLTTSALFGTGGLAIGYGMLVVGASRQQRTEDPQKLGNGEVYVFDLAGDLKFSIRPSDDPADEDSNASGFGDTVAISSDRIIVGAQYYVGNPGGVAGRAYQFNHSGRELQAWFGSGGGDASNFGSSMDAAGGTLVIGAGAGSPDASGRAYIYPLTGTPTGTLFNLSSSSYTGTLNGPTLNTDGSFQFDGTDDDIDTGLSWTPANQFSFTMWFNLDTIKEWHNLVDMFNTDAFRNFQLFVEGDGDFRIFWGTTSGTSAITGTVANEWYFGAFTCNGETGDLYRYGNGTTDTVSATATGGSYSVKPLVLGRRGDSSANGFVDGKIGEFQFYNTELTAAQILQNYNATKGKYGV